MEAVMLPLLGSAVLGSFVMFAALWVIQVLRRDAGVVDIGWSSGVGAMAVAAALVGDGWVWRRVLVAALGAAWAFRLAGYILFDRVLRPGEDGRYAYLRAHWGKRANAWFFVFFTSQSLLVALFALPFIPLAQIATPAWRPGDLAGLALWLIAVGGETLADRQLARFRRAPENRGRTCRAGLWRYSRHPNYFFEWLHWWAYVVMAIGAGGAWLALTGPLLMYLFLMRLTGIPYTEKRALASRGEDYAAYQRTTSRFFPWPPRKEAS